MTRETRETRKDIRNGDDEGSEVLSGEVLSDDQLYDDDEFAAMDPMEELRQLFELEDGTPIVDVMHVIAKELKKHNKIFFNLFTAVTDLSLSLKQTLALPGTDGLNSEGSNSEADGGHEDADHEDA